MLQSLLNGPRLEGARKRLASMTGGARRQLAGAFAIINTGIDMIRPYAVTAFHYGFIPFVIVLGMRTEPKPKLLDLLMPM